ncbi:MAG: acetyl-CoA carboxylase biotin carboxyl carrier protein subunit [Bacteroidales bacterium]|jgi:biotin carboxyl carrier protein|nr:acetyl-CoA carboxylase biotin carboxyl carrier protein subunit [Bacteroidales bacterium]
MEKYNLKIDGNDYEVEINIDQNIAEVLVNGKWYKVEIEKKGDKPVVNKIIKQETPKQAPQAPKPVDVVSKPIDKDALEVVKSPLPGNIIDVLVSVGETVKKDDIIIVIEAMKMENNIIATSDGIVRAILATPGKTVMVGDPLLKIEKTKSN